MSKTKEATGNNGRTSIEVKSNRNRHPSDQPVSRNEQE